MSGIRATAAEKLPMFQGEDRIENQDFLDQLRPIAHEAGKSLAQLVVNWTIQQPGIDFAYAGAKRPEQASENAGAMGWKLTSKQLARIDAALRNRSTPVSRSAV